MSICSGFFLSRRRAPRWVVVSSPGWPGTTAASVSATVQWLQAPTKHSPESIKLNITKKEKTLTNRARVCPCWSTAVAEETVQIEWPQTKRICNWWLQVHWLVHEYNCPIRNRAHSRGHIGEQQSYIFPGPEQLWVPVWRTTSWMDFIPNITNWIGHGSKSLVVGVAVHKRHRLHFSPPDRK